MDIAIIPARAGSKRIKNKNIKLFCGKPIIYWTIQKIKKSNLFDKIIVTSDSNKILKISKKFGADVLIKRNKKLSNDITPTLPVVNHSILNLTNLLIDNVCCIYPCNPFLNILDIKKALLLLKKNKNKFVVPITPYPHPIQRALKIDIKSNISPYSDVNLSKRTQDLEGLYHDAGQFYFGHKNLWLGKKTILKNSIGIKIPSWRVVDIDNIDDWKRAERIFLTFRKFFL